METGGTAEMARRIGVGRLLLGLSLVAAAPVSLVLGAAGERWGYRYTLDTPGSFIWKHLPGRWTYAPGDWLRGFWFMLAVDGLCCWILIALLLWGLYAATRALRAVSRRSR